MRNLRFLSFLPTSSTKMRVALSRASVLALNWWEIFISCAPRGALSIAAAVMPARAFQNVVVMGFSSWGFRVSFAAPDRAGACVLRPAGRKSGGAALLAGEARLAGKELHGGGGAA